MTKPIFRSTTQALHFAYIIQAYEVSVESIMSKAIRRLMMECGVWRDEPSSVDFGGLSQLEVRAQCAMIRSAVISHLPDTESWTIQARYGVTDVEDSNGARTFHFSRERTDAIMALSDWIKPQFDEIRREALDLLVARHFSERAELRVSFRTLSDHFGASHMTYARAFKQIRGRLYQLESVAVDRLTPLFQAHGVVESHGACQPVTAGV